MMYPETNFNYDSNNENKGNRKQRRQNKSRRNLHKAAAVLAGVAVIGGSFWGGSLLTQNTENTVQAASTMNLSKDETTPDIVASSLTDYSDLAAQCLPQVVSVTNVIEVTSTSNGGSDLFNFFYGNGQNQNQTSTQESEAYGSGVIIGKTEDELLIVTNNHVAVYDKSGNTMYYSYTASTKERKVTFVDGTEVEANLKGADSDADIAVLAVKLSDIPEDTLNAISVATIDNSDGVKVGQGVMAIGNALGLGQTTTFGHVSALNKDVTTSDDNVTRSMMQIDAAINAGNSGGGLFDANGHLIGINSAKSSGEGVEGMGYAIPISSVSDIIENLMNQETKTKVSEAEQGQLGIQGVDVTADSSEMYNMPTGVYVSEVIDGGGAKKAGITKGSVITGINGTSIDGMQALKEQLQYYRAGETVKITVATPEKNGEYAKSDVEVTLGKKS